MSAVTIPPSIRPFLSQRRRDGLIAGSRVDLGSKPWLCPGLFLVGYFAGLVGLIAAIAELL